MSFAERPPAIAHVLRRHLDDAAFYWSQVDGAADAPLLSAEQCAGFGALLTAHLEGLRVGGQDAALIALQALERWRKPGEAFVAFFCALGLEGPAQLHAIEAVLRQIRAAPDVLARGAISAVAWTPVETARRWTSTLSDQADSTDLVIALRSEAFTGQALGEIKRWLQHPDAFVRAASCRCADLEDLPALVRLANDADLMVRAEAAIARGHWLGRGSDAERLAVASALWQCVMQQLDHYEQSTGWYRLQAERRLKRWVHQLALAAPIGHPGMRELVGRLPARLALIAVLHHGDVSLLHVVARLTAHPEQGRWAGWVWQCMTGLSLASEGLVLDEPEIDLDAPLTQDRRDADQGLALPDPSRVAAHPASHSIRSEPMRTLLGHAATPERLQAMLHPAANLPQPVRVVASRFWNSLQPQQTIHLRAKPEMQQWMLKAAGVF